MTLARFVSSYVFLREGPTKQNEQENLSRFVRTDPNFVSRKRAYLFLALVTPTLRRCVCMRSANLGSVIWFPAPECSGGLDKRRLDRVAY
jgi:hypothetical protein